MGRLRTRGATVLRGFITGDGFYYESAAPMTPTDREVPRRPGDNYTWDGTRWVPHMSNPPPAPPPMQAMPQQYLGNQSQPILHYLPHPSQPPPPSSPTAGSLGKDYSWSVKELIPLILALSGSLVSGMAAYAAMNVRIAVLEKDVQFVRDESQGVQKKLDAIIQSNESLKERMSELSGLILRRKE